MKNPLSTKSRMRRPAILVGLFAALASAEAQELPCAARNDTPCVSFDFDRIPPGLPAALRDSADEWLRSGLAGEERVFGSVRELHALIESEWRQVYPHGGEGAGSPWDAQRRFLVGRTVVPEPWTSVLLVERHYFGGAHGNYRVTSRTVREDGTPVTWEDLLSQSTRNLETRVRERLARHYQGHRFEGMELLPPDAWRATAAHLELWWDPYRIGSFAMEYEGPRG